jgi:hypothetical protein
MGATTISRAVGVFRHRRWDATTAAIALLAASCGPPSATPPADSGPDAATATAPTSPAPPPPQAQAPRTIGGYIVQATTAPEWTANGTINLAFDDDGVLVFGQALMVPESFELRSLELETLGASAGISETPLAVDVSVLPLPDGDVPDLFDANALPTVGTSAGSLTFRTTDFMTPGDFATLELDEPIEVPAGRTLVLLSLRTPSPTVGNIVLSGRRGDVGAEGECADHNPAGSLMTRDRRVSGTTLALGAAAQDATQGCRGTANFNITFRMYGAAFDASVAEEVRAARPVVPPLGALVPTGQNPPASPPSPSGPSAPAGPPGPRAFVDTASASTSGGSALFYWNPRYLREIGQTIVVEQPFSLAAVEMRPSALTRIDLSRITEEQWLNLPESSRGDYEVWTPEATDVRIRVTVHVWRVKSGSDPGTRIDVASALDLLVAQRFNLSVDFGRRAAGRETRMTLSEPLVLDPGRYLISFLLETDDPTILTVHVDGWQSGNNTRTQPRQQGPEGSCQYTRHPDVYPQGRAYIRNTEPFFLEHGAKVQECIRVGSYDDIFNPGDIRVRLLGTARS